MYSLVFIMFKLSRLGSCWNNYLAFLSNFAACMRPGLHPELLLLILVIILERELQLHSGESGCNTEMCQPRPVQEESGIKCLPGIFV